MSEIHVIGVEPQGLSQEQMGIVAACGTIVVSRRFRNLIADCDGEIVPIAPVKEALDVIAERVKTGDVAVLASGDPLFFGIGRTLVERFGADTVVIHPVLSAMQLHCARFREPWDDAAFFSLHGRETEDVPALLLQSPKTVVFTDNYSRPDAIARLLLDYCRDIGDDELAAGITVKVGESLGSPDEKLVSGSLAEICNREFADLNIMLLKWPGRRRVGAASVFGLSEADISHSRGLITKSEVRAVALHSLQLPADGVFWDVGAGSGSVSLEAGRFCPQCRVFAVERHSEELANIRRNIRRYRAYNIKVVAGEAPDVLEGLPAPDRVFVGGSGGRLPEIVATVAARLKKQGRIVITAVTRETIELAPRILRESGFFVTSSTVQVTRRDMASGVEKTLNPITIFVGSK